MQFWRRNTISLVFFENNPPGLYIGVVAAELVFLTDVLGALAGVFFVEDFFTVVFLVLFETAFFHGKNTFFNTY